nr:unnamed protein product [Digitaria exilis]
MVMATHASTDFSSSSLCISSSSTGTGYWVCASRDGFGLGVLDEWLLIALVLSLTVDPHHIGVRHWFLGDSFSTLAMIPSKRGAWSAARLRREKMNVK